MGAYIYASGTYHPLEGNKVVSGGAMTAMKAADEIVVDGSRYQLGNNIPPSDVESGLIISSGTSTYTSKLIKDCYVMDGGNLQLTSGKITNLQLTSGGTASLSAVTDITSSTQLDVAASGYCELKDGTLVTSAKVGLDVGLDVIRAWSSGANGSGFVNQTLHTASRGHMTVMNGGSAQSLIVEGGQIVVDGGLVSDVSVSAKSTSQNEIYDYRISQYDQSNRDWVLSPNYKKCRGYLIVNGGQVSNCNMVAGEAIIQGSGAVDSLSIGLNCSVYVQSGGAGSGLIVSSGGYLYVSSGGLVSGVTISSGGSLYVSSGGAALGVIGSAYNHGGTVVYANN